jgi:hypothetical protein
MSLSGMAAAATLVSDSTDPLVTPGDPAAGTTDTTLTFEDLDGNGVDDDCQDVAPVALPEVVAAAFAAVDLNGDGTISTSEAAQSDWVGGPNCNHGGYVSGVAGTPDGCGDTQDSTGATGATDEGSDQDEGTDGTPVTTTDAVTATCQTGTVTTETPPTVCTPPVVPAPVVEAPVDTSPNAHGKAVSLVAQSDAVGGKNCNHGGAVSAAAKKDHSGPHGNSAKGAHGKGNGKGKGHGKP